MPGSHTTGQRQWLRPCILCYLALTVGLALPARAQTPLVCGQPVNSSLSVAGETDFYAFGASAGDAITLRVTTAGGRFPQMELFAPGGARLKANDPNSGSGAIDATLSTAGIYTVTISGSFFVPQGDYRLVWQRLNSPCNATTLSCGQAALASLDVAGEIDFFSFSAAAGDAITLRATTGRNAPQMELYSATGARLAANNPTASNDPDLIDIRLPAVGVYTVVVSGSFFVSAGGYRIVWQRFNNPCNAVRLTCGESVPASLAIQGELDFYTLSVAAGDVVMIRAATAGAAPRMELYTPEGTRLAATEEGEIRQTFSVAGSYSLLVGSSFFVAAGDYTVVWQKLNGPCVAPDFSVRPDSLSFSAAAGTSAAVPSQLELRSGFPGLPWEATVRTQTGGRWLAISPEFGQMPAAVQVTADATALTPGTYQGSVEIAAPGASPPTATVPATFTVGAVQPARLAVDPPALSFAVVSGGAAPAQSLRIANAGAGSISWTASGTSATGDWLRISPPTGVATASAPAILQVSISPAGLAVGSYSGSITIRSAEGQSVTIPVTLLVSTADGVLLLSQGSLAFRAIEGGGAEPAHTFGVLNAGGGALDWTAEAVVQESASWLRLSPSSGTSQAGAGQVPLVSVSVEPGTLAAGLYSGLIRVRAAAANNSPQMIRVDLQVLPRGTRLGAVVRPSGLIFVGSGATAPAAQEVTVSTAETAPVPFINAPIGGDWVTRTPDSGAATREAPGRISVQARPGSLAPAVYRAGLTVLTQNDGELYPVGLLYVLLPPGTAPAGASTGDGPSRAFAAACTPSRMLLQMTSLFSHFSATAGWPVVIRVNAQDDCGSAASGGVVTVSFSSGEPPLVLIDLGNGQYVGSWRPAKAEAQVVVTARGYCRGLEGQAAVTATVLPHPNPQAAILNQGGVLLGAGFERGPVAPGSIISLFGTNLSDTARTALALPLPSRLGGVRVIVAEREAPLFYAGPNQVNAQMPFELPPERHFQLVVETNGVASAPEPVQTTATRPGIFTLGPPYGDQGAILIANTNRLAMPETPGIPSEPARPGGFISIYCTGLGATEPAVASGEAASASPLAMVRTPVRVTIGGLPARVTFAGLAPGFAGVYQVDAEVPSGATAGSALPVVITQGGSRSNSVTIAVR